MYKPISDLMCQIAEELIKSYSTTNAWKNPSDFQELDTDQYVTLVEALVLSKTRKVLEQGIIDFDNILPTMSKPRSIPPR